MLKICVSLPINNYYKFEVIYNTSKINLYQEYVNTYGMLNSEITKIQDKLAENALQKITDRIKNRFPSDTIYRLWLDRNCYIENIITPEICDCGK